MQKRVAGDHAFAAAVCVPLRPDPVLVFASSPTAASSLATSYSAIRITLAP